MDLNVKHPFDILSTSKQDLSSVHCCDSNCGSGNCFECDLGIKKKCVHNVFIVINCHNTFSSSQYLFVRVRMRMS